MDSTSTSSEAQIPATLTTKEEFYCHKTRIFSLLTKAPVVRAWKDAICDGALYLGKAPFPASYADRYFQTSSNDIAYVTFSVVTAFKELRTKADGQETEGARCHISKAQRKASEFLIVTFDNDHDRIALLPHKTYWPVDLEESIDIDEALPDGIPAEIVLQYSFSINFLLAHIEEVKRSAVFPMFPTTAPFQFGLDGKSPKADPPKAIMPQASGQMTESDHAILLEERALRTIRDQFRKSIYSLDIDFLDYQPLLRDFKMVISRCDKFANGLEVVVSHNVGHSKSPKESAKYADYLLTHSVLKVGPKFAFFVPRRLIPEAWFKAPHPRTSTSMPSELIDCGHSVRIRDFIFKMDKAGNWVENVWKIILKYPPGAHPTPAEKMHEIWKKALPWPEIEAQRTLQEDSTLHKAKRVKLQLASEHDAGTGSDGAADPSEIDSLAAHYLEKASKEDKEDKEDKVGDKVDASLAQSVGLLGL